MDKGAWRITVQGVIKELDMAEWLSTAQHSTGKSIGNINRQREQWKNGAEADHKSPGDWSVESARQNMVQAENGKANGRPSKAPGS